MKVCPYEKDFACDYGKEDYPYLLKPHSPVCCLQPSSECPKDPEFKKDNIPKNNKNVDNSIMCLEP